MSFFKKQQSLEPVEMNQVQTEKDRLSAMIEDDVSRQLRQINHVELIKLVENKQTQLNYIYSEPDDYKHELLKKIVFYIEMIKEIEFHLAECLRQNEHLADLQEFKRNLTSHIETHIQNHYDTYFKRYLSSDQGLKGLEKEYRETLMLYQLLLLLLPHYAKAPITVNDEIPKRWVVRKIKEECKRVVDEWLYII
ncbi:hypothetical protein [Jeotgalibacillus aurantiacus]|uniref:hypothetical protein n=1 Tax=Jeotgalibacillus aurantiacus TaxID=2763266 RepID=UPI001D0A273B|nr:hypothetical protein [Jeotgalibacillus aurantiacus]